jgi:hypothetical protein
LASIPTKYATTTIAISGATPNALNDAQRTAMSPAHHSTAPSRPAWPPRTMRPASRTPSPSAAAGPLNRDPRRASRPCARGTSSASANTRAPNAAGTSVMARGAEPGSTPRKSPRPPTTSAAM